MKSSALRPFKASDRKNTSGGERRSLTVKQIFNLQNRYFAKRTPIGMFGSRVRTESGFSVLSLEPTNNSLYLSS